MTSKRTLRSLNVLLVLSLLFSAIAYAGPQSLDPTLKKKDAAVFGNGSFLEDKSTFTSAVEVQMSESNGYVYLSWVNNRPKNPIYYVSIAKDGKWLVRNKKVFEASGVTSPIGNAEYKLNEIVNLGNVVYLTYLDMKGMKYYIRQVSLDPKGTMTVNKTIFTLPITNEKNNLKAGQIRPVYTSKGPGVIFHKTYETETVYPFKVKETAYTIFLASTQAKAASFTDSTFALYKRLPRAEIETSTREYYNAYWDIEGKILYHNDGMGFVRKFNTATGKAVVDAKNNPVSLVTKAAFLLDNQYLFAYNSVSKKHWVERFDNKTMKTKAVSDYFNLDGYSYNNKVFATSTEKEIHVWEITTRVDSALSPALKLTTVTK
ncbi:hypothetical protein [Gorillibacterium timonense]|uniref:hypothetical protein n=1 Tax=Gorillibacterium timonense TaxID=1689269 RepID=UPI00071E6279|nr:hypothetical protein [Gorillibacterium timonense]